jgi:hypothetical protein
VRQPLHTARNPSVRTITAVIDTAAVGGQQTGEVLIGQLECGLTWHRAILFKYF